MFHWKRGESDFSAEIAAHIALETERLQERGLTSKVFSLNPTSSYLAKSKHRIYLCGSPGWKVTGQHCDRKQEKRHGQKHKPIVRANTIQQTCHHGRSECRKDQSGNYYLPVLRRP